MDLHLAQTTAKRVGVLSATGEIDVGTSTLLQPALWKLVDDHAGHPVVFDVRGVTSVDHLGIGVIVGALARATRNGGDLVLVCHPSHFLDLLKQSRLDRAFQIYSTVLDAAEAIK
jgi:anti-sigma B factor antagonist